MSGETVRLIALEDGSVSQNPADVKGTYRPMHVGAPTEDGHSATKKFVQDSVAAGGDGDAKVIAGADGVTLSTVRSGGVYITTATLTDVAVMPAPETESDVCDGVSVMEFVPSTVIFLGVNTSISLSAGGDPTTCEVAVGDDRAGGAFADFASADPSASSISNGALPETVDTDGVAVSNNGAASMSISTQQPVFLNIAAAWGETTTGDVTASGTIVVSWIDVSI
jgi:hypothetical protein